MNGGGIVVAGGFSGVEAPHTNPSFPLSTSVTTTREGPSQGALDGGDDWRLFLIFQGRNVPRTREFSRKYLGIFPRFFQKSRI